METARYAGDAPMTITTAADPTAAARRRGAPGRLPDPRPAGQRPPARLPRLGVDEPEAEGRHRRASTTYYREYNANVHRGIYTIGEKATAAYEAARVKVARFINAPDSHEVVFTRNATEAINLVAYSWGRRNIDRGDAIVLTEMEHHANLVPWQLLVQERDGDLEFIPITDDGILRLDVFEVLLRLKPKLVAFTHVSNTLGTINPVREMVEMAHAAGALVLIDGAQAVPHVPVDVQALGADFYAFSGHKMLGPTGSGALWGRRELLEAMPPFLSGGEMIREVHLRRSDFNDIPWKFEAGTPAIGDAIGLGVAADYLTALGMDAVREHERDLVAYALETLPREVPDIALYGPMDPELRGGVVPFNLPGIHPHDVAQVLDRFGVASAPATTARCRSTSASIWRPPPARASTSTRPARTSTPSPPVSGKSSGSSTADHGRARQRRARPGLGHHRRVVDRLQHPEGAGRHRWHLRPARTRSPRASRGPGRGSSARLEGRPPPSLT